MSENGVTSRSIEQLSSAARNFASLPPRRAGWFVAGFLTAVGAVSVMMLLLPGKTVLATHLGDLLTFLDAADRLARGQVPNRDFHSPLGPLAYALLALGYVWSGLGGMMLVATAVFAVLLLPLTIYACLSRLPWPLAVAFGVYILILSIAPAAIGEVAPRPMFAMFYNRFGYALLSLLFLFVLPRNRGLGSRSLDIGCMAALWLLLFYLKITYAAVGGAFLLAAAWFPHVRREAFIALVISAVAILIVELFWSGTAEYLGDIRTAASATGTVRGGAVGLLATTVNNIQGVYLFGAVLLLALISRVRYDYLLLCLFMGAAGILLDRHNAQGPGILTFVPGSLVAALAPRRDSESASSRSTLASILLIGALVLPVGIGAAGNLAFHFLAAMRQRPSDLAGPAFPSLMITQAPTSTSAQPSAAVSDAAEHGCGSIDPASLNLDNQRGQEALGEKQFLAVIQNGVGLLEREPRLPGKVFVPDLANPFNALTRRMAPTGVSAFYDAEITFSEAVHPRPDIMFRDVDVVMVPKYPQKYPTFDLMRRIYGRYLESNFELVARSECWDAISQETCKKDRVIGDSIGTCCFISWATEVQHAISGLKKIMCVWPKAPITPSRAEMKTKSASRWSINLKVHLPATRSV